MSLKRFTSSVFFFYVVLTFSHGIGNGYAPAVYPLPTRHNMPVANVNAVIQDREGYMWYATYEGGLCRDNAYQIDVFRKSKSHPGLLTDNVIYSLCECSNGEIWFSTAGCVYFLSKTDYSIHPVSDEINGFAALEIACQSNGNMLLMGDTLRYEVTPSHQIVNCVRRKYTGRRRILRNDENGGQWVCRVDTDLCYVPFNGGRSSLSYDIPAQIYTFVANIYIRSGDQSSDLALRFAAERTSDFSFFYVCHSSSCTFPKYLSLESASLS